MFVGAPQAIARTYREVFVRHSTHANSWPPPTEQWSARPKKDSGDHNFTQSMEVVFRMGPCITWSVYNQPNRSTEYDWYIDSRFRKNLGESGNNMSTLRSTLVSSVMSRLGKGSSCIVEVTKNILENFFIDKINGLSLYNPVHEHNHTRSLVSEVLCSHWEVKKHKNSRRWWWLPW